MSGRVLGPAILVVCLVAGVYVMENRAEQAGADPAGSSSNRGCPAEVAGWDRKQTANAKVIVRVAGELDMPDRAVVVALATAMQESNVRNVDHGPPGEDSAGVFQQRPSQGWGSRAQVMDVEHAATSFFLSLRKVDGWEDMRVTDAAQRVQRSAFPEAYQKHVPAARKLAKKLRGCRR
jgi:hypothetical protein